MNLLKDQHKLLSALSHDVLNPLGAVMAFAELLLADETLSPKATRQVESIARAASRIEVMFQKLVRLSQLEAGGLKLERDNCDPASMLLALQRRHDAAASKKKINFRVEHPARVRHVAADLARLGEVLDILVTNAVQYSPAAATIVLAVTQTGAGTRFSVKDSGPGLRPDEVEAFCSPQPGALVRPARGLSLLLARRLVEAHGARLSVKTSPGQGAEFAFTIAPASARDVQALSSARVSPNPTPRPEALPAAHLH